MRVKPPLEDASAILGKTEQIDTEADRRLAGLRAELSLALESAAYKTFGTLKANNRVAEALQATADRVQAVLLCHKCKEPGRLKCWATKDVPNGVFGIAHGSSSTHGGTAAFPKLECAPVSRVAAEEDHSES